MKSKPKQIKKPYLFLTPAKAGFPSPASDDIDKRLDLNEFLVPHPAATFFVKVDGDSMIGAGINSGDILVIDRSCEPRDCDIILAVLDGEFTVKTIRLSKGKVSLEPKNDKYPIIEIKDGMDFKVWGVVTGVIRKYIN